MKPNWKDEIREHLGNLNLTTYSYGLFKIPLKKPFRLYISDTSIGGNAWGKIVIEGKTWHEVYDKLASLTINDNTFKDKKMHETADM